MSLKIQNKEELRIAIQDFNALKRIHQEVEVAMSEIKDAIRVARNQFHIKDGQANELSGPNGGVTFSTCQERLYKPIGIKKHLGEAVYEMFTEVKVNSKFNNVIRDMAEAARKDGKLTDEQIKEIVEEVGEKVTKVIPRLSKASEFIIPFHIQGEEDLTYRLQSPKIVDLISKGFVESVKVKQ